MSDTVPYGTVLAGLGGDDAVPTPIVTDIAAAYISMSLFSCHCYRQDRSLVLVEVTSDNPVHSGRPYWEIHPREEHAPQSRTRVVLFEASSIAGAFALASSF